LLALCLFAAVPAGGCGNPDIDLSAYGKETVAISGLPGETDPVNIKVEDLAQMSCVTLKTESTSDKIGVVRATGPLLKTLLESYGTGLEDFSEVTFTASDGYEITLDQDFLKENRVILAFGVDGKPLDADEAPLRIIIPGSDSAYWIRMVTAITLKP
jgi:DMSO/TMAO reductase YedYZ molybdopterin-dependent catalytic subunit